MFSTNTLFAWLISHQPAVLFSQNKPATSNQPAVLFSQDKPAPATSQPNRLQVRVPVATWSKQKELRAALRAAPQSNGLDAENIAKFQVRVATQ
jgi:hypothetical protein